MNSWFIKLLTTTVVIFSAVYLLLRFAPALSISSVTTQKTDLFSVSAEGKVTVVPDTGIVSVGITVKQSDVKSAQNEANTVIDKITQDLKKLGIDAKDIKTQNYSIYPQYDYRTSIARITGYQVSTNLKITIRDLAKINSVIDTATTDGANNVGGISLTVDDDRERELLQEARQLAIAEAKSKAQSLASAAGITLGRIVNIQESGSSAIAPMLYAKEIGTDARAGGADTNISPGSTDITTSITLYYETR